MTEPLMVYTDGASRGNPGPSAVGVSLQRPDGHEVEAVSALIEDGTNNAAEYHAAIRGLQLAAKHTAGDVELRSDSELLIRQLTGEYRVKHAGLALLHADVMRGKAAFSNVSFAHVRREHPGSRRADQLANEALIKAGHPKVEWKGQGRR